MHFTSEYTKRNAKVIRYFFKLCSKKWQRYPSNFFQKQNQDTICLKKTRRWKGRRLLSSDNHLHEETKLTCTTMHVLHHITVQFSDYSNVHGTVTVQPPLSKDGDDDSILRQWISKDKCINSICLWMSKLIFFKEIIYLLINYQMNST